MTLHPQSQQFLEEIAAKRGPGWHEMPVQESRRLFISLEKVFGRGPELEGVEDQVIDGQIPIRIYRPASQAAPQPVILYFHGGGWVLGNIQTHDGVCRHLARATGCVVISVDYRLAPEHKYPAALNDAYAATAYVSQHAEELGIDAQRLIVAGDSAGGNLAAAVSLKSRDENGPKIAQQILIYPVIEPNFQTASYVAFGEGHGLTKDSMQWFWEQYMDEDSVDRKYLCLANANTNGLPPTFVLTAEYDVLRDEGENYATRLRASGVATQLKRYPGMLHGFVHFAELFDDAAVAFQDIADSVRKLGSSS